MTSVQFLGSGDAFGSGGRLQTCILVQDDQWRCLLDCGATSLIGLKQAGIDPATIDAIVISHLHGDHFGGLPFLLLDAQFNSPRSTPLLIAGHAELEARLRAAMDVLFPGSQRALEVVPVEFIVLDPSASTEFAGSRVEVFEVEHFCGATPFGIRLTTPNGSIVAYSGDSEWTDTLVQIADGADLFIVEAYFFDKKVKWHLDYETLIEHRPRFAARRLIATHPNGDLLDRLDSLELEVADDGLILELPHRSA
jgi:ribonuclease BN (tRNA processing enzyme)